MANENLVTSQVGINLVKEFEGCYLSAYRDPIGVWTIGYGHTKTAYPGMTISYYQAEQLLKEDLKSHVVGSYKYVKVQLTQNQFDALASFQFNLGPYVLYNDSVLLNYINSRQWEKAAGRMKEYDKANGVVLPGLVRRRVAEAALFLKESLPKTSFKKLVTARYEWDIWTSVETWEKNRLLKKEEVFYAENYVTTNNTRYYEIYKNGKLQGYSNADAFHIVKEIADPQSILITKNNYTIWKDFYWNKLGDTSKASEGLTYTVKKIIDLGDGRKYYELLRDNKFNGYLNIGGAKKLEAQRVKTPVKIVKDNYKLWSNLYWSRTEHEAGAFLNKTVDARYIYDLENGNYYYSIYQEASSDKWLGLINVKATDVQFEEFKEKTVLFTKGNYPLWQDFTWKNGKEMTDYTKGLVYNTKRSIKLHNDQTYLELTRSGKFEGYVNMNAVKDLKPQSLSVKMKIVKNNYKLWRNLYWSTVASDVTKYMNKTVEARNIYDIENGDRYYSMFETSGDKWIGLINVKATDIQFKQFDQKPLLITKGNYPIWQDLAWKNGKEPTNYQEGLVYNTKRSIKLANEKTYYELTRMGQFKGYINTDAVKDLVPKAVSLQVQILKTNYELWGNLYWGSKKNDVKKFKDVTVEARYIYDLENGDQYYSVYDLKTKEWLGHINVKATK